MAFISTKSKTRQKWPLDSVSLTDAYTDFLLSRQASRCTPATIAFYNFTAGKFLEYLTTQITSLSEVGAGHFRAYLVDLVKGPLLVMNDWLAVRGPQLGGLFHPVNIGGKLIASRMTAQALYKMLIKRGAEGKVQDFSPSRYAAIFHHRSTACRRGYRDRRPEEAKQKAASLLHLPYKKK